MALLQLTLLPPLGWRCLPFGAAKIRTVFSRFSEIRKRQAENYPEKVSNDTWQCILGLYLEPSKQLQTMKNT